MTDLRTLHTQAMALAEKALLMRGQGKASAAGELLRQALEKEHHAALLAVSENAPEPTRSVLLKSAAQLAMDCNELRQAERLIAQALAGEPPAEIANELRAMFRNISPKVSNGHKSPRRAVRKSHRRPNRSLQRD